MRNSINGMGLVLKIPWITANEWQMGINDTITNNQEWYILFVIVHYHSYFIYKIKLFFSFYHKIWLTLVKSHLFTKI